MNIQDIAEYSSSDSFGVLTKGDDVMWGSDNVDNIDGEKGGWLTYPYVWNDTLTGCKGINVFNFSREDCDGNDIISGVINKDFSKKDDVLELSSKKSDYNFV